jgi:hypothetical protein
MENGKWHLILVASLFDFLDIIFGETGRDHECPRSLAEENIRMT